MRAQSQTLGRRPQIGIPVQVGGLDWLSRLYHWVKAHFQSSRDIGAVSPYGTWDAEHERFHPLHAEAAVDLVAARQGVSWAVKIYSASM